MSHSSSRCITVPGRILLTAFSPDGRLLAVSGVQPGRSYHEQGFLQVYDAYTLEIVQTAPVSDFPLPCLAWSPDSTQIASAGPAGVIGIWDWISGTVSRTYYGHSPEVAFLPAASNPVRREVLACCWPTNDQIVSAGKDTCICQWNPQNGETVRRLVSQSLPEHLCFSPSGTCLAILPPLQQEQEYQAVDDPFDADTPLSTHGSTVSIFDISTEQTIATLPKTEDCFCAAWAPKTGLLALGSREEILIWDLQRSDNPHLMHAVPRRLFGEALSRYQCHPLAWSPDGIHLAYCAVLEHAPFSSHWDNERFERALIEILDARSGTTVYSVPVTNVFCLAWAPDGKRLVVGRNMEFEVLTGPFSSDSAQGTR